jgi:VWFA-related protein
MWSRLRSLPFPIALSALIMAVAGGIALATAQESQPTDPTLAPFAEQVEVRVVNVDVVVTDRDGQPVGGLTREDFVVLEDGRPQPITNFYVVDGIRVRGGDAGAEWEPITADSSFRRRILLLIDNNFVTKPHRDNAVNALHDYLNAKFDGTYEWGVIAVGDEVQVLEPFTSDKLRLRAALDRIKAMPTNLSRYRADREVLNDPVRVRLSQRGAASREMSGDLTDDISKSMRFESRTSAARNLQACERTAGAMIEAFRAYGHLDGKKILVWVTGGVPMLPEYGFQSGGGGGASDDGGLLEGVSGDPQLAKTQQELRQLMDRVAHEANAAQFKVYPVKVTGVQVQIAQLDPSFRSSGASINESAYSAPVEVDDNDSAQLAVALGTGGLYLTSNAVLESFDKVDRDTSTYYSLGFSPTHPDDGAFHKIAVEVKRPGLTVRARRGYVDLDEDDRLEQYLSSPLTYPKDKGTLPVTLDLQVRGPWSFQAMSSMPAKKITFVEDGEFLVGRVHIYMAIHDRAGQLVDMVRQTQDVRFPAAMKRDYMAGDFNYGLRFKLKQKGEYTISVTLRDEVTDEMGTALKSLTM